MQQSRKDFYADVRRLHNTFSRERLAVGAIVTDKQIISIIHHTPDEVYYGNVVRKWQKEVEKEFGIILRRKYKKGYIRVLDSHGIAEYVADVARSSVNRAIRATELSRYVDTRELGDVEAARFNHNVRYAREIAMINILRGSDPTPEM